MPLGAEPLEPAELVFSDDARDDLSAGETPQVCREAGIAGLGEAELYVCVQLEDADDERSNVVCSDAIATTD